MELELTKEWYEHMAEIMEERPKILLLNRGLPGSGKSYSILNDKGLSEPGASMLVCSTDHYFEAHGEYLFDHNRLGTFHKFNQQDVETACLQGYEIVIVDNTNTTWKEIKPYVEIGLKYGYKIEINEPMTPWKFDVDECAKRNSHGVPKDVIQRMKDRWEDSFDILEKISDLRKIIQKRH